MEPSSSRASKASRSPRPLGQPPLRQGPLRLALALDSGPFQLHQGGFFFLPCFFYPLQLLPVFLALQGLLVGLQGGLLLFQLPDACAQSSGLGFQSVQGLELLPAAG